MELKDWIEGFKPFKETKSEDEFIKLMYEHYTTLIESKDKLLGRIGNECTDINSHTRTDNR